MTNLALRDSGDRAVTVVTITRDRVAKLSRAMKSVAAQQFIGKVRHLIIIDECNATFNELGSRAHTDGLVEYVYVSRPRDITEETPERLARLRNLSAHLVRTKWMAFLDDDNEYESEHLASLLDTALSQGAEAVYSHDRLYHEDGSPYLERRWPWARDENSARALYEEFCRIGVMEPGSNLQRHTIRTDCEYADVLWVDTNVWLFETKLLRQHPIPQTFGLEDWEKITTEDDKMLQQFVEAGIRFACSHRPTVRYYLGGYSNRLLADGQMEAEPGRW